MNDEVADWKLKLKYGKMKTDFKHYTALAEGIVGQLTDGFQCRSGPAIMGMKTWAIDADQSGDMINVIGKNIGFTVTGEIQIYETQPDQPPRDKPFGYDIQFTAFDENA